MAVSLIGYGEETNWPVTFQLGELTLRPSPLVEPGTEAAPRDGVDVLLVGVVVGAVGVGVPYG